MFLFTFYLSLGSLKVELMRYVLISYYYCFPPFLLFLLSEMGLAWVLGKYSIREMFVWERLFFFFNGK